MDEWNIRDNHSTGLISVEDKSGHICEIFTRGSGPGRKGRGDEEHLANARKIAAVPALLDAIEQAIDDFADGHSVCEFTKQQLIAALAKARGTPPTSAQRPSE